MKRLIKFFYVDLKNFDLLLLNAMIVAKLSTYLLLVNLDFVIHAEKHNPIFGLINLYRDGPSD
jgi:hypothetical protein